ncbi:MAG: PH domain-containing protein [Meiothermus sp.]|nr:PH domain-containing protein [Meiothermus sp.]
MKLKTLPLRSDNPRPWLWPLVLMAVVTLPLLWLTPILWGRSVSLAMLTALIALPGLALAGLLASWMLRFPQMLAYELTHKGLTVQTHYGPEQIGRSQVVSARPLEYALRFSSRSKGHFPGYYVGTYTLEDLGPVSAYVAARRGPGVLLELQGGGKVLLSPESPDDLLRAFR